MGIDHAMIQMLAKRALSAINIEVSTAPGSPEITLTDLDQHSISTDGARGSVSITPTQLEYACEQYRLISGEDIDAAVLIDTLEWA